MKKYIENKRHKFEIVQQIPENKKYGVWNIPADSISGYLPYCQLSDEESFSVNVETLLAVRVPSQLQKAAISLVTSTGFDTVRKLSLYWFSQKDYLSVHEQEELKKACLATGIAEGINPFTMTAWNEKELEEIWKQYN